MAAGNPITGEQRAMVASMARENVPDWQIGERLGLAKGTVTRIRCAAGIRRLAKPMEATPEQLADLRVLSNHAMQRKHGSVESVWRRLRVEHGIAPFRPATVVAGKPAPWKAKPEPKQALAGGVLLSAFWRAPEAPRDSTLAGEAAAFLRSMRFPNVFSRAKVYGDAGWQVGRSVLSEAEMIGKAERMGFRREGWMV